MADIVERLEMHGGAESWAVRGDAADEIKRLRAEIDRLRTLLHGVLNGDPQAEQEARAMLYGSGHGDGVR